jgi:Protein of unknown function (DUF3768)
MTRLERIRILNDNYRSTLAMGGGVLMSRDFYALPATTKRNAFDRIVHYRKFAPNGQHDAGLVITNGQAIAWRIEYRAVDFKNPSPDPSDPDKTIRILIVELAAR